MSFQHALKAVIPHASADKTLPLLNSVNIDPRGGKVRATDRYTLGESTFKPDENTDLPEGTVTISLADAKTLAKVPGTPVISYGFSNVHLPTVTFDYRSTGGPSYTFAAVGGEYPNLDRLFSDVADAEPTEAVALNLTYLARFDAKHLKRNRHDNGPGRLTFYGSNKPVLIRFEDHFRGLIVPVRFSE